MPTENRSSNTDPRDVFIRLNPLGLGEAELRKDSTGFEDQRTHSDYLLFLAGYRETHPEPQPHPEPIAWMVGTAFWWTKEEAERDAAAMGLPIVGLGPMTGIAPAEQHQGDPVGEVVAFGKGLHEIAWAAGRMPKLGAKLYTSADPCEVERLSKALTLAGHWCASALNAAQRVNDAAESLGDIASLLRHQAKDIEAALSYSAESIAPIAWHVGGNGYDRICFEKPADLPGRPCIQAIHDQRQLIELLKRYDLRDEDVPPDDRAHGIPSTSFQRLIALANKGE
ncbi:hypothetical protein LVV80_14645 [Pseudomonas sp. KCA11]|uniref:hypothetical protein n=1 Tax=Pseudomonas sp. KCA11 TaxID=2899114 RepID=UPI001F4511F1|nr:hypothetical protein [Pseudomonas sp. KCA11]MCE5993261.1 hypothetical protein [Pseudomonas sp. KCA11]